MIRLGKIWVNSFSLKWTTTLLVLYRRLNMVQGDASASKTSHYSVSKIKIQFCRKSLLGQKCLNTPIVGFPARESFPGALQRLSYRSRREICRFYSYFLQISSIFPTDLVICHCRYLSLPNLVSNKI